MKTYLMLLQVVTVCLLSLANAQPLSSASTQYKTEDGLGNYAFGYNEDHAGGGSFRREAGDRLGNKAGSYGLHGADGRARLVNYVADAHGFRADVHTNEPGVDPSQDPAHVAVNKPALAVVEVAQPVATSVVRHHVEVAKPVAASLVSHHSVVAAPVAHKTVLGPPLVALAGHLHHAVGVWPAVYHHHQAVVGPVPHVLIR